MWYRNLCYFTKSWPAVYLFVPDLRQELAVRHKERRPSSSLGKDSDRADVPGAGNPSIPVTPSKPISSFATPPASSIRRGKYNSCVTGNNYSDVDYTNFVLTYYVLTCFCLLVLGDGLTGTPLTTSARISALNIVGELLRKVGVRDFKIVPQQSSMNTLLCHWKK